MARPIIAKSLADHRLVLVRMQRSIEVDDSLDRRQKQSIIDTLELAVAELGRNIRCQSEGVKAS